MLEANHLPIVSVTEEMLETALEIQHLLRVNRTIASPVDSIVGALGEFAFAEWIYGNWAIHDIINSKGLVDFENAIEIKTSAFPFSNNLNLLVRQDYAKKRKPKFYVQVIINTKNRFVEKILPGTEMILAGFTTSDVVDKAPLKDFGSKYGGKGGYKCHHIRIDNLTPMSLFPRAEFLKKKPN